MDSATLSLSSRLKLSIDLSDDQFFELCQRNRDYRFERTVSGELLIMPPTGSETGNYNGKLTQRLFNWADTNELGIAFDSSTGFKLPNGANRSPDASWVKRERWEVLTAEQRKKFAPICPDFVVELRSETDFLKELQEKMREYRDNGARLGWLIDRKNQRVEIYRLGQDVEVIESPATLLGEEVFPGFILDLQGIM